MEMTPEKLAFIKGQGKVGDVSPKVKADATPQLVEKVIDVKESEKPVEPARESTVKVNRRSSRQTSQEVPGPSEVLDQILVPVTIRLSHRMAQALRRAYLEQRLKHAKPETQQEIVEEALGAWLLHNGFLE